MLFSLLNNSYLPIGESDWWKGGKERSVCGNTGTAWTTPPFQTKFWKSLKLALSKVSALGLRPKRPFTQVSSPKVTLPAHQKTFVDDFFELSWEFCIEKWRGFLVIFSGLRLPRNEARQLLKEFGENPDQNSRQNSG